MATQPIPSSVIRENLDSLSSSIPGAKTLLQHTNLAEKIVLSTVSAIDNKSVNDYISEVSNPESLARGRSKASAVKEEPEPEVRTLDPIKRPNGDLYHPRMWGSVLFDVEVLQKGREHAKYALVQGEPGTGKTALAEAAFAHDDLYTVIGNGDTEVSELVGQWVPRPEGGFEWVDGPLVRAAEEGKVLYIDEIGLVDSKVLAVLYAMMDGRQEMLITQNPTRGIVKAQPGFYVFAATNPNAPGVRLSEALLSRFSLHAEITTDYDLAIRLGVPKKIVGAAQNLAKRQKDHIMSWAPQMRELLDFRDTAQIYGDKFAYENMIASAPARDRHHVKEVLLLVSGEKQLDSAKV